MQSIMKDKTKSAPGTALSRTMQSPEFGVLVPLLVVIIVTSLINPNFLSVTNWTTILKTVPFIAITSLGMSFVIMTGKVDISVGRVAGLAGMVFAYSLTVLKLNLVMSFLLASLCGAAIGLLNGILVVKLGLFDFAATIGTLYIAGGARFLVGKGYPLGPLPYDLGAWAQKTPLGLSWPFWLCFVLFVLVGLLYSRTLYGRRLRAVGNNLDVARFSGINVDFMRISAYVICGICAAIAGILLTCDLNLGVAQNGDGWEFKAIASCAVGGVSLTGGRGSTFGLAIGVILVNLLDNVLIMVGIPSSYQRCVTGLVLAGAVLFDIYQSHKKVKA